MPAAGRTGGLDRRPGRRLRKTPAFLNEEYQARLEGLTLDTDGTVPDADGYLPLRHGVKDPRSPGQRAHDILFGLLTAGVGGDGAEEALRRLIPEVGSGRRREVLHLGRDVRLFQPAPRIAAGARCHAPPSWCEIHHVIPQILAPPWINPDRVWETVGRARIGLATTRMRA